MGDQAADAHMGTMSVAWLSTGLANMVFDAKQRFSGVVCVAMTMGRMIQASVACFERLSRLVWRMDKAGTWNAAS